MPSYDDEEWSPKLPCLFADFVDLYRAIIKIVVTLKPSSEVLFWLRLMRMITLKLRRLGDVIQPFIWMPATKKNSSRLLLINPSWNKATTIAYGRQDRSKHPY
jgi:hypothetical protein